MFRLQLGRANLTISSTFSTFLMNCTKVLSKSEIKNLIATPTWAVHDLFDNSLPPKHPPNADELNRLAKMSGLNPPSDTMKKAFYNQLRFVEVLRDCDTTEIEPVTKYVEEAIIPEVNMEQPLPISQVPEWRPLNHSSKKSSEFYIVKSLVD